MVMRIAVTGLRGVPASWGGVEHHCEEIFSRLAARGHAVTVYARSHYVQNGIQSYKGIVIRRLPTINNKFTEAFIHTVLSTAFILKENPDIIHIHAQGPCMCSWLPRLFRPRMRIFFTCHGLDWKRKKWPWWASRFIYLGELCSTVFPHYRIAVSKDLQKYYIEKYRVPVHYIPNGIKKPERRSPHLIQTFGLSNRNYFLFVGRIVPEKRAEDIIQAYLMKNHKTKLVIVGESADTENYITSLRQMAKNNSSILFVGYQFGEILEELYSNARAFITSSELEGLPITLLEALSYGTLCIASDIQPHQEVLGQVNGLLYRTGDVASLAQLINQADEMSGDMLDAVYRKSAEIITELFNWDTAADMLEKLYMESLNNLT